MQSYAMPDQVATLCWVWCFSVYTVPSEGEGEESVPQAERGKHMNEPTLEILERVTCYDGFFRMARYRLRHRLFNGSWSPVLTRELFERGQAAAILLYDPQHDAVVLVEQFRIGAIEHPDGPWLQEIVAGIIDDADETPEAVARREAIEEANCQVQDLIHICDYYVSPGGTSERIALFCGQVDTTGVGGLHGLAEESEDIRVTVVPFTAALTLMHTGKINSAAPIIALQWLQLNHDTIRARWCR